MDFFDDLFLPVLRRDDLNGVRKNFQDSFVNERHYGMTALHFASLYDSTGRIVEFLLRRGCDIEAVANTDGTGRWNCENGWRSIHIAAYHGNNATMNVLIKEACILNCESPAGETPLQVARRMNKFECVAILEKAMLKEGSNNELDNEPVTCGSCGKQTIYAEVENHYNQCSKVKVLCEKCGFLILRLENLNQHQLCHIRWDRECPFGCNTIGIQDLLEHRKTECQHHTDILWSVINHAGLDRIMKRSEGTQLSAIELYDNLKMDVTNDLSELRSSLEQAEILKRTIALKRLEKNEQMRLMESFTDTCLLTSFNGSLLWMINENEVDNERMYSPVFYTGKYGYKLQLLVTKDKEKNDQKLYLQFLSHSFDPILLESFSWDITIEYKHKDKPVNQLKSEKMSLDRNKEELIKELPRGILEWIKFTIDCSELEWSSID